MKNNISKKVIDIINKSNYENNKLVFLCIGTDRVTGDAVGPIVGSNINNYIKRNNINFIDVIGNLENPLCGKNINNLKDFDGIKIVIDSAVSNTYKIGDIIVEKDIFIPRKSLNSKKTIKSDIVIKAIVNNNKNNKVLNFVELQNVRLNFIIKLSNLISKEMYNVIDNYILLNKLTKTGKNLYI